MQVMCRLLMGAFGVMATASLSSAFAASTAPARAPLPEGCVAAAHPGDAQIAAKPPSPGFPPVQVEATALHPPVGFANGGRHYLFYELLLRNFSDESYYLQALEFVDADAGQQAVLARLTAEEIAPLLSPVGASAPDDLRQIESGKSVVAFICLAFEDAGALPKSLRHHIEFDAASLDGPTVGLRQGKVRTHAPAVTGEGWTAADGPNIHSHHRTGLFVVDGVLQNARRFAIDWKKYRDGKSYAGDARDVRSYFAYDEPVTAVANGVVVKAVDGLPDNIPRTAAGFETAVDITMATLAGNTVVIDTGDGQFAHYAHLKAGSLTVKEGDRVKKGQQLARIGNSGDAREPHLHFQLSTSPEILAGEGVPFVIDRFCMAQQNGECAVHEREFPLGSGEFDFARGKRAAH